MAAETRGRTLTRMLIAIFEGDEGRGLVQLPRLLGLARLQNSSVRVAYFRRIPRDRTDRYDRIVADRYREMLRIEEAMREAVAGVLRAVGQGPVECVVRFGSPVVEVEREAEADDALDGPLAHRSQHAGHRLPHRLLDAKHLAVAVRDDPVVAVGAVARNPAEVRDAHARILQTREPEQPWQLHEPAALVTFEDRDQHPRQRPAARLSSHGSPGRTRAAAAARRPGRPRPRAANSRRARTGAPAHASTAWVDRPPRRSAIRRRARARDWTARPRPPSRRDRGVDPLHFATRAPG